MPLPSTMTPIATNTLTTATASVTFSNLPQGYTDLVLVAAGKSSSTVNDYDVIVMRLNGNTGTNYSYTAILGDGVNTASERGSNVSSMSIARLSSNKSFSGFDATIIHFINYSNTTTNKTVISRSNAPQEFYEVGSYVGLFRSTDAISTILIYPGVGASFASGSTFTIYGVKAA